LRAEKLEQESSVSYAGIIGYLTSLLLSIILLSQLFFIDPIHKLSSGFSRISQGRLATKISLESGDEFEKLGSAINAMTQELIQKEKLAEFVSDEVLKLVRDEDAMVMKPGGELLEATMMFCEPCGFSDWAMHRSPAETVLMLNNFIAEVAEVCSEFYGSIDKLDDATIMVVFRSRSEAEANEQRACRAALRLSQKLNKEHAKFPFNVKSGISSGMVVSGKIGSNTGKLDFTVIGDAVNTAARLKSIAEGLATNSRILVSQAMAEKISAVAELRAITDVTIKGKAGKHKVFELLNIF
jgi:adenylate cyclase